MKTIFLIALIAVSTYCFNVDLKSQKFDNGIPVKDELLTFKTKFGGLQYIDTVFDIANSNSWVLEKNVCTDCIEGAPATYQCQKDDSCKYQLENLGDTAYGFGGQVQFVNKEKKAKQSFVKGHTGYEISGEPEITNVDTQFPITTLPSNTDYPKQNQLTVVQAAIGLGQANDNNKFVSALNNKENGNVKTDNNSFSLFYGQIKQIIFGSPQGYFKTGEWTTLENVKGQTAPQLQGVYSLRAQSITVDGIKEPLDLNIPDRDAQNNQNTNVTIQTYAIFSSTSKYITFNNQAYLKSIVKMINKVDTNANCRPNDDKVGLYYYCNITNNLPKIILTLGSETEKQFTLLPEDYTEKSLINGVEQRVLLFRKGLYNLQSYTAYEIVGAGQNDYIWLGYPFFNRYYTNFQYKQNKIQFAEKYNVQPEKKTITNTFQYTSLILGTVGALAGIGCILALLSKVPWNGEKSAVPQKVAAPQVLKTIHNLSPKRVYYQQASPSQSQQFNPSSSYKQLPPFQSYQPTSNIRYSVVRK